MNRPVTPGPLRPAPTLGSRQQQGVSLVSSLRRAIRAAAGEFDVPAALIGVIVMHESQAAERSTLGGLADAAESAQAWIQGDTASIGVIQMRVGLARQLRHAYPSLQRNGDVVDDLLDPAIAVRYLAARLRQLRDLLRQFAGATGASLSREQEIDMMALGYNIGWDALRDRNLRDASFGQDLPARVETIRARSRYLRFTTAYLATMENVLSR
jgi:hypothetical protein